MRLLMAYYGDKKGILSGLTKSTDHPRFLKGARNHIIMRTLQNIISGIPLSLGLQDPECEILMFVFFAPVHTNLHHALTRKFQLSNI